MWDRNQADRREGLFGGRGAVYVWDALGAQALPPFSAALLCELEPAGSVGAHVQQRDPELIIGVSGEGVAVVGGQERPLRPGVAVTLAHGQTLALRNERLDEPLRYLIVKATLGA